MSETPTPPFACENCGHPHTAQEVIGQCGDCSKCHDTVSVFTVDAAETIVRLETELTAARAELAALRAEQGTPLDRPDKPGYWWRWCDIFKKWEGPLWISLPAQTSLGKWLPAAPPRDLREGGE